MLKFLLIAILSLRAMDKLFVMGWSLWPAKYWVEVDNRLTMDTVEIHCTKVALKPKDLGVYHIPVNSSFNWSFKTNFATMIYYNCNLTRPNHGYIRFTAFHDYPTFVDKQCGGRHCTWKTNDTGVYLYNIKEKKYTCGGIWPPGNEVRDMMT